jgi:DNA mismatch endonuclease, patch repair protein
MRAIRPTSNASTEWRFRGLVVKNAIKDWKLHEASVLGTPDFFFPNQRGAVFVDECFWHGCPTCGHVPKANSLYWMKKLARNKRRDSQIRRSLRCSGIRVIRIWECELRVRPHTCLTRLLHVLNAKVLGLRKLSLPPARSLGYFRMSLLTLRDHTLSATEAFSRRRP